MSSAAPLTERRYVLPFILITGLFFLWAVGVNLNDILIPHLKKAFGLTDFRSSLIQSAFFGGYFLAALPAGYVVQKLGYKKGILIGLCICATGTFLFLPAATARIYEFFLFALFVMACGQCFLEVASNPYIALLGPRESSARRLNVAASFNSVGAVITPILGAAFILSGIEHTPAQLAAMTPGEILAYRVSEANMVKLPYLCMTGIFLLVAVMVYLSGLPEVQASAYSSGAHSSGAQASSGAPRGTSKTIWRHPHLIKGMVAQFFYVGAQIGVASFVIRFAQRSIPGIHERNAAHFLQLHLLGFMIGRFAGSALLKQVSASRLLSLFSGGALLGLMIVLLASGQVPVWAVVGLGFCHSVMFPTIFALSLKDLGPDTKLGSSLLVMSIIGGALCPAAMGVISDATNIQKAFVVPLVCHAYVFYFSVWGYKTVSAGQSTLLLDSTASEIN